MQFAVLQQNRPQRLAQHPAWSGRVSGSIGTRTMVNDRAASLQA